jgi:hypothetical protein
MESNDIDDDNEDDERNVGAATPKKKRKRAIDVVNTLDQFNPHFAVQIDDDGDVVVLSDDSEVSSLHSDEINFIRDSYKMVKCNTR